MISDGCACCWFDLYDIFRQLGHLGRLQSSLQTLRSLCRRMLKLPQEYRIREDMRLMQLDHVTGFETREIVVCRAVRM